ncbi:HNH endonuclease [Arthrobacter phoenicis]|uniref:HNH endonuclease n=1 Tax=unclassified Arthrobacter TaxID=235627 RepID=UPI0039A06DD6
MTTSRTGTSTWKKLRKRALHLAQAQGLTHCPYCSVQLDYAISLTPCSAEVDHVIPHSKGGRDRRDETQVICRRCNQSKGNRPAPKRVTVLKANPLRTSRQW